MRRKWTDQQKKKILADWHESVLNRADFCEKFGMSVSALDGWRRKFDSPKKQISEKSESKIEFVELPSLDEVQVPKSTKILRIISSYGAVIEVPL